MPVDAASPSPPNDRVDTPPAHGVTLLFTDIEGSTALWEAQPDAMRAALRAHDALLRQVIGEARGHVFKTVGDGVYAVFQREADAVAAALRAQAALAAHAWPAAASLKVRMALHAGVAEARDGDYFGPPLNRLARLLAAGHGGQTLLSQAVADATGAALPPGATLHDLGMHRLKDLARAERVFELRQAGLRDDFPPIRSLSTHPNNLPQQLTTFVGRVPAIAAVGALLATHRLVTLTGSGGSGKTRLALQVAAENLARFPDGAWLVELAAVADPALVPQALAAGLQVTEARGVPLLQTVAGRVAAKALLVVLDNCEHLLDACATAAEALLQQCPHLRILATSREPLQLSGEQRYRVPPLAGPAADAAPAQARAAEAVALFAERAASVRPEFVLDERALPAVMSICRKLDGLPLAIELAAARVAALSVTEIDARLDQRLALLSSGSRTALPRHRTLRALVDWSYDLLTAPEQRCFRACAVFAGSFTLDAVQGVWDPGTDAPDAIGVLESLAGKSLVVREESDGRSRFHLLDTLRAYAHEKLVACGEHDARRARHRDHFLAVAEDVQTKAAGAAQAQWLARLAEDRDNFRAAVEWCGAEPAAAQGLRLCTALQRFWRVRGHFSEGRALCERILALPAAAPRVKARADALNTAGVLAYSQGDFVRARSASEESLAICRETGERAGEVMALNTLGNVAIEQGDYRRAEAIHGESLACARALGDLSSIANSLVNLGILADKRSDYATATALLSECLAIRRRLGDRFGIAVALNNLANVAYAQGDKAAARALHEEGLGIRRELADRRGIALALGNLAELALSLADVAGARALGAESLALGVELGEARQVAHTLVLLGAVQAARGRAVDAARVWGAAERLHAQIGLPFAEDALEDAQVAGARAAAGADAFAAAWREGRDLTLEQAVALASAV